MADDDCNNMRLNTIESVHSRGYQLEMFERSMTQNVIVAMDTGSGKTHVALLRIAAELDRCLQNKRIWFLAPSVELCIQQHGSIVKHLPYVQARLLVGSDNVDRWSEARIWNAVLDNIQVVVSTYAVLLDALRHGFVKIVDLALLIFDEAHHCTRNHPANRIMQEFYFPAKKEAGRSLVPHILGLSASPIMRSRISELATIEANLDSVTITPRENREELLKHVHRPRPHLLEYTPNDADCNTISSTSIALSSLKGVCLATGAFSELDMSQMSLGSYDAQAAPLTNLLKSQLVKFYRKAVHVYQELGAWAANYFILESISALATHSSASNDIFFGVEILAREALLRVLDRGQLRALRQSPSSHGSMDTSDKVEKLLVFLEAQNSEQCSGLLFVQQRAVVGVLCKLLSLHPRTQGRFKCATFVGMSNNSARKYSIVELLDLQAQRNTLGEFRARGINLIITTNVLEEGIDVTACNVVISFDPPQNLKSLIQRRGRARHKQSDFVIMVSNADMKSKIRQYQILENELIKEYQSERKRLQQRREMEEDTAECVSGKLLVKSTGACITPDSALAHIHHFCACLPKEPYVDLTPRFSLKENPTTSSISATLHLPNSLCPSVRSTAGLSEWRTSRAAIKDACFQAYTALYEAGLLNDNLLPKTRAWTEDDDNGDSADLAAMLEIAPQYDPYRVFAESWSRAEVHSTQIILRVDDGEVADDLHIALITPQALPHIPPIVLNWDDGTKFCIEFLESQAILLENSETIETLRSISHLLVRSTHSDNNASSQQDYVFLFCPALEENQLADWYHANQGRIPVPEPDECEMSTMGLVRCPQTRGTPYHYYRWRSLEATSTSEVQVECIPLTRNRNFQYSKKIVSKFSPKLDDEVNDQQVQTFPIRECTTDRLPLRYLRFSLCIKTIMQHIELLLVADRLRSTSLNNVSIKDIELVKTAITAPSTGFEDNYQNYEFIGDAVLKLMVSHYLFCDKETWHEGYLTKRKSNLVSNQSLAKAAIDQGLDAFVVTSDRTSRKWTPPLVSTSLQYLTKQRQASMKMLADVVEALIGAAYLDGGADAARICLHIFLPEVGLDIPISSRNIPILNANDGTAKAEAVIGYEFKNKLLLLESLTHPSCDTDINIQSYQRLEFLGDAVLDMLVVRLIASSEAAKTLSPGRMTLTRAALVNAHLLGYLCLDYGTTASVVANIEECQPGVFRENMTSQKTHLWELMRHSNSSITASRIACAERYQLYQDIIHQCLIRGDMHPWLPLARLQLDKFYSDMIEAILGALYLDSHGDLDVCEAFLAKIGLVSYLERVLNDGVNTQHPKSMLGELAGKDKIAYKIKSVLVEENHEVSIRYMCTISVGTMEVGVENCLSKEEAVILAATTAIGKFKGWSREPIISENKFIS